MEHFADRLLAAIDQKKTPLIVGLDPVFDQLPPEIQSSVTSPRDSAAVAGALGQFCKKVLLAVAPHVAAVKVNSAYFETCQSEGWSVYQDVLREASRLGLMVIADVKRGDVGHSATQYALATLAKPPFDQALGATGPDAVTINSYLGSDGVEPFLKIGREEGKGAFALVRTSNPSAAALQDLKLETGEPVYLRVGRLVAQWGSSSLGRQGYSALGAVVGATNPAQMVELRKALPQTLFLVPGFGAQGGSAHDAAKAFNADGRGAVITASRSIIFAYKDAKYRSCTHWTQAVEQATLEARSQIAAGLQGHIQ